LKIFAQLLISSFLGFVSSANADTTFVWREEATTPRLEKLEKQLKAGDSAALDRFWSEMKSKGTPLIETIPDDPRHLLVTFLYRPEKPAKSVVLFCQLSETRDYSQNVLKRFDDTGLWYKAYWLPNNLRLSYSFVPDPTPEAFGGNPSLRLKDPLNPKFSAPGVNIGDSILELPGAPPQPWIAPRPGVPSGKVEEEQIESKILKTQRTAWIYTPPGFDAKRAQPYPLLVCFDGPGYGSDDHIPGPTILDNLIAEKKLPPTLLLLIAQAAQPQRNIELSNNPQFLQFVTDELLPVARNKWHATADPSETTVCGSSAGGLASAYFAFRRPDVFGNVIAQSGALWPGEQRDNPLHEWLTRQYESSAKLPIRFVLQPGVLETGATPLDGPSILSANRQLRDVLVAKGYEVHYSEMPGGHEALTWRGGLGEALVQLAARPGQDTNRAPGNPDHHLPVQAIQGITSAFQKHPVVIIGETHHGYRQMGDFLIALVRDPEFQAVAPDILIEFASQNNQPLVDRYISGEDIPVEEVRYIWRDTTKVGSWEFPIYAEWLAAIRDVNKKLPAPRRLRVLAGDTPIDWNKMKTHEEWLALGDNNKSFANVITNQVLKNKRKVLVVLGGNHVGKLGSRTGDPNVTTLVEASNPGSTYVVMHYSFPSSPQEEQLRLQDAKTPALYDLAGTPLGETPDSNGVAPVRYTDAWLYLGPRDSLTESLPPPGSLEASYGKELDRRSMIEWGELRIRKFLGNAIAP